MLYCLFCLDYFLHFSARIPGLSAARPTMLLFLLITISLVIQGKKTKERFNGDITKRLNILIIYFIISLPLVEFGGSVLSINLISFLKAAVFFYFTVMIIDSEKRLKILFTIFLGCQVFRVLEPTYMHITDGYWGSQTYIQGEFAARLSGSPYDVINPNELGFLIVTVIPFLHFFLAGGNWLKKLIYFGLLGLLLYALVLTMSRGAFVALLVIVWFIYKKSKHKFLMVMIIIAAAIGGWSQMNDVQKERYLSMTGADVRGAKTASGRIDGIGHEFALGFERPIVGHGLGTTAESKFHKYGKVQASHSLYAELLIEIGIIGGFLFLKFIYSGYRGLKHNAELVKKLEKYREKEPSLSFILKLNEAQTVCFWMYLIYSINYWGLSSYYWYLFSGITVVLSLVLAKKAEELNVGEASELK